jgi:HlyD family secretion protein
MDIKRPTSQIRNRRLRYALFAVLGIVGVVLTTVALSRLKPAAPSVDRATLWTDRVKRGQMLRQVRGLGTLVPENIRIIAASTEGRVEQVYVQPGTTVDPGTVLITLSNPQLEQEAIDAEFQVRAAEADANNLRVRLESERMTQQSAVATVQSEYNQARLQLETDEALAREGLVPQLTIRVSRVRVQELANRLRIEQQRLAMSGQATRAQTESQNARIEQLRALARLRREQVASLAVRAGTAGVLQQMQVEVGQQVTPGTNLARVADPTTLKAAIQIPETQVRDVQLGQLVQIDTRGSGVIPGRVARIDPAVQQGTVTVDVTLEGGLPQGARPDLSVDGTIELERLDNVLYVGRPAFGAAQSTVGMFRLEEGGREAVRVPVRLGRSSVNTVEILDGLREGDEVILSDTSQWDDAERLRLN